MILCQALGTHDAKLQKKARELALLLEQGKDIFSLLLPRARVSHILQTYQTGIKMLETVQTGPTQRGQLLGCIGDTQSPEGLGELPNRQYMNDASPTRPDSHPV